MSTSTLIFSIVIALAGAAGFQDLSAHAGDLPPAGTVLWNQTLPKGGWRPFGAGTQDSEAETSGLKIIADWTEATWGVGVIYPDPNGSGGTPLPPLSHIHKIQFEVRGATADQTTVTVELSHGEDKNYRATDGLAKPLSTQWQTLEFEIPGGFDNLAAADLEGINTVRVLFLNTSRTGGNSVEIRNVALIP